MNHMHTTCTKALHACALNNGLMWCLRGRRDQKACLKQEHVSSEKSHIPPGSYLLTEQPPFHKMWPPNLERYSSKAWSNVWRHILLQKTLFFSTSLSKTVILKSAPLKVGKALLIPFCAAKLLNTNEQPSEHREAVSLLKVLFFIFPH